MVVLQYLGYRIAAEAVVTLNEWPKALLILKDILKNNFEMLPRACVRACVT